VTVLALDLGLVEEEVVLRDVEARLVHGGEVPGVLGRALEAALAATDGVVGPVKLESVGGREESGVGRKGKVKCKVDGTETTGSRASRVYGSMVGGGRYGLTVGALKRWPSSHSTSVWLKTSVTLKHVSLVMGT
jgi:hypothetical protein